MTFDPTITTTQNRTSSRGPHIRSRYRHASGNVTAEMTNYPFTQHDPRTPAVQLDTHLEDTQLHPARGEKSPWIPVAYPRIEDEPWDLESRAGRDGPGRARGLLVEEGEEEGAEGEDEEGQREEPGGDGDGLEKGEEGDGWHGGGESEMGQ